MGALKNFAATVLCQPVIGRLIAAAYRGRVPSLRFPGWRVETGTDAVAAQTIAQIFWGVYESAELRFVQRHLRRDLDVVEVGSSIGAVSSAIAQRQDPDRRLVCVEANSDLLSVLRRNIAANAPGHRVDVVNRAIDYHGASVRFAAGPTNVSGHVAGDAWDGATTEVPASTLAELLREQGIREYALVSDIEGAEAGFIDRDAEALASCQQILIELHETELDGRRWTIDDLVRTLVERHGFTLEDRHGPVCVFRRAPESAPASRGRIARSSPA